jgi:hypothetical protein
MGSWEAGEDVFCLHCDGVFKTEDVNCGASGYPVCPVCNDGSPIDFHSMPWWREDLISEDDNGREWIGSRIVAVAGKPRRLPPEPKRMR